MSRVDTFFALLKSQPKQIPLVLRDKVVANSLYLQLARVFRRVLQRPDAYQRAFYSSVKARIVHRYKEQFGRVPNLKNPTSFSEKAQWRKLYCPDIKEIAKIVDKRRAYEYARTVVDEKHLLPIEKVLTGKIVASDISSLGDGVVIQPTHRSGQVFIIERQEDVDSAVIADKLNIMLKWPYSMASHEPWYGRSEPAAIVRKLIKNSDGSPYLNDLKIHVFPQPRGNFKYICWVQNRNPSWRAMFDEDFQPLNFRWNMTYPPPDFDIPKPEGFDQMLEYARELAKPFDYARVDFMLGAKEFYFTEVTFASGGGVQKADPPEMDEVIGSWWHLDTGNFLKRMWWFTRTWLPLWRTERPMRNVRRLHRFRSEWGIPSVTPRNYQRIEQIADCNE